jgi:DNA-directed RNA polymerase subunit RPC12/RpoP
MNMEKKTTKPISKLPCNLCGKFLKNQRGLSMHTTTSHRCSYCSGTFTNLAEHTISQHEQERCTGCSMRFASKEILQSHMKHSHQEKCDLCEENFFSTESLEKHRSADHEEECDRCGERLLATDGQLMEQHLDTQHGVRPRVVRQFAGGMFMIDSQ